MEVPDSEPVVAAPPPPTSSGTRKGRSSSSAKQQQQQQQQAPVDAALIAILATAAQQLVQAGFPATAHVLQTEGIPPDFFNRSGGSNNTNTNTSSNSNSNSNNASSSSSSNPTATNTNDPPYHVHWSKTDMVTTSFRTDVAERLSLFGALRGYRMARASHGVSSNGSTYYYECVLLPGPSAMDLMQQLPSNARLGPGLKEQLQAAVAWEQRHALELLQNQNDPSSLSLKKKATGDIVAALSAEEGKEPLSSSLPPPTKKQRKTTTTTTTTVPPQPHQRPKNNDRPPPHPGGHVRLGWSMRTADLQAPVGYDKWSYAIRTVNGSLVHNSQRQDHWGGEPFYEQDVIGCCISFNAASTDNTVSSPPSSSSPSSSSIRFFKNGNCLGKFAIVKGKLDGGIAFTDITPGTYYPAVSCYLGGSVRANFGPYWICPPKKSRLGLTMKPMSSLRKPPNDDPDEAVESLMSTIKLFKKADHQQAIKKAIREEALRQREAYEKYMNRHVEEIKKLRIARGASISDLPDTTTTSTAAPPQL